MLEVPKDSCIDRSKKKKKKNVLPGRQIMREGTKKIEQRMDEKPMQLNSSEGPAARRAEK